MLASKILRFVSVASVAAFASSPAIVGCSHDDTTSEPGSNRPAGAVPLAAATPTARAKDPADVGEEVVRVPVDGLPSFGRADAPVTIVAFTDYECPYCAKAEGTLATLRSEYGERLRVVVASHPLPMHENAGSFARAFLAAAEQGKGEAMHDRLFARQRELHARMHGAPGSSDHGGAGGAAPSSARDVAASLGLDLARFDRDLPSSTVTAGLARAEKLGNQLGVQGTPSFFVNGRRLVGARPVEAFRALVDEELAKADTLVKGGLAPADVYASIMARAPEHVIHAEAPDAIVDVPLDDAPTRGSDRAPVTIVLFGDFECPYSVKAEATLRELAKAQPNKVKIAFRHKPLPFHHHARLAAKASLAAERQGRFWQYHDVLLGHRDALERTDLERYASEVGLDVARFGRDLDDPALEARIAADERRADALDVRGTPTSFVNGRRVSGAQPMASWLAALAAAEQGAGR